MSKTITKKKVTEKTTLIKADIFNEFAIWGSLPTEERYKIGAPKNLSEFAERYGVDNDTLTRWKKREDYIFKVEEAYRQWSRDKTADVFNGIYKAAVRGNPGSQLLYLQYFRGFNPKTEVVHTKKIEVGVNDIRYLIEQLPEELKKLHYANLQQLFDDAQHLRNTGQLENSAAPAIELEGDVQEQADNDAQVVPVARAYEIPSRYQECVCENMERQVSAYNHQSAARWG